MVKSLLSRLRPDILYRIDVNYSIENTNIHTMLGRTAHTLILDNEEGLRMIVARYKVIFG